MSNRGSDDSMCALPSMSGTQHKNCGDCQRYSEDKCGPLTNHWEIGNESCNTLKGAIIGRLNPDTNEDYLAACEQLTSRCFQEGGESIDELAQNIEKLLVQLSPGLPTEICDSEL